MYKEIINDHVDDVILLFCFVTFDYFWWEKSNIQCMASNKVWLLYLNDISAFIRKKICEYIVESKSR